MPSLNDLQNQMKQHLSQFAPIGCPICSGRKWAVGGELSSLPTVDAEYKMPIEGRFLPVVVLICENCKYVTLFSAGLLGILQEGAG